MNGSLGMNRKCITMCVTTCRVKQSEGAYLQIVVQVNSSDRANKGQRQQK